ALRDRGALALDLSRAWALPSWQRHRWQAHRSLAAHPAELPDHLLHLAELVQEMVHLGRGGSAALGDPPLAAAADDLGPAALLGRHREDDRLDPLHLLLLDAGQVL